MRIKFKVRSPISCGDPLVVKDVDFIDQIIIDDYNDNIEQSDSPDASMSLLKMVLNDDSCWECYDSNTAQRILSSIEGINSLDYYKFTVTRHPEFAYHYCVRYYLHRIISMDFSECPHLKFLKYYAECLTRYVTDIFMHVKSETDGKDGLKDSNSYLSSIRTIIRYTFFFLEDSSLDNREMAYVSSQISDILDCYNFFDSHKINWDKYCNFLLDFCINGSLSEQNIKIYVHRLEAAIYKRTIKGRKSRRLLSRREMMDLLSCGDLSEEDIERLQESAEASRPSERKDELQRKYFLAEGQSYTSIDSFMIQQGRDKIDPFYLSVALESLKGVSLDLRLMFYFHLIFSHPLKALKTVKFTSYDRALENDQELYLKVKSSPGTRNLYYFSFLASPQKSRFKSSTFYKTDREVNILVPLDSGMQDMLDSKVEREESYEGNYVFDFPAGVRWDNILSSCGIKYKKRGSLLAAINRSTWSLKIATMPPEYIALISQLNFKRNVVIPLMYSCIDMNRCNRLLFNIASRLLNREFPLEGYENNLPQSFILNSSCLNLDVVRSKLSRSLKTLSLLNDSRVKLDRHLVAAKTEENEMILRFLVDISVAARAYVDSDEEYSVTKIYEFSGEHFFAIQDKRTKRGLEVRAGKVVSLYFNFLEEHLKFIKHHKLDRDYLCHQKYKETFVNYFDVEEYKGAINLPRIFAKSIMLNCDAHYTDGRFMCNHLSPGHSPLGVESMRPYNSYADEIVAILDNLLRIK